MPVGTLAERLEDRFHVLTSGSRTALPRQQTLRALVDWSYNLLSEREQMVLNRLSVFSGGWSLEAAEAVCATDTVESWEVADLLSALVEKSLVTFDPHRTFKPYYLLETIRQYGQEKLNSAAGDEATRLRHVDYYVRLVRMTWEQVNTFRSFTEYELRRLTEDSENLFSAFDWCGQDPSRLELSLTFGACLFWV